MSDRRVLPARPDLRRLRDEAKARRRTNEFPTLARAQLAIAREYGFASWPRLKVHVEAVTLDVAERADALVRSACSSNVRRAVGLLAADPGLASHDLASACVAGDAGYVAQRLEGAPELTNAQLPPFGWEPILYACFSRLLRADPERAAGIRAVARLLLDAGADPNASFDHEDWLQVPLYGAAGIANDVELTRMLIVAGADPNDAGTVHTVGEALYHATEFPDPTCAALLIDAGTAQEVVDYCLGRALNFPNAEMVQMFCAHGARPWAEHLHQAVWRRRPERTVRALLDAGAPIDTPDEHGLTPLQIANRWGQAAVAALLVERGADSGVVTAEDRALGAFLSGATSAPPDAGGLDEMLILAVQGSDLDGVRRLLDAGARVDGDPDTDDDPLGQAAWRGEAAIVRELVRRGAQMTFGDGGSAIGAALHGSRHCHHPEGGPTMRTIDEVPKRRYADVVRILIDAGAAVPQRRRSDRGPAVETMLADLGVEVPG
jgi:hypothetical protein